MTASLTKSSWLVVIDDCGPATPHAAASTDQLHCDICGHMGHTHTGKWLVDGRFRCRMCHQGAVDSVVQIEILCGEVLRFMTESCDFCPSRPIRVRFADAFDIAHASGKKFTPTSGYDWRAIGLSSYINRTAEPPCYELYVEYGHSAEETMLTLVHELTHVWQDQILPDNCNDLLREGLACWMELYFIRHKERAAGSARWAELLTRREQDLASRTDDYGAGYRQVSALLDESLDAPLIEVIARWYAN